jgi:hypothetical protein
MPLLSPAQPHVHIAIKISRLVSDCNLTPAACCVRQSRSYAELRLRMEHARQVSQLQIGRQMTQERRRS